MQKISHRERTQLCMNVEFNPFDFMLNQERILSCCISRKCTCLSKSNITNNEIQLHACNDITKNKTSLDFTQSARIKFILAAKYSCLNAEKEKTVHLPVG